MNDRLSEGLIDRTEYEQRIASYIDTPLIKVITGIRRSGKSSLMKLVAGKLINRGISSERILYINMESIENEEYTDYHRLFEYVRSRKVLAGTKIYLFIDEVQEISGWEKAINSFLSDNDADIYISGSNSRLLSGELATLLSGRYVNIPVFPLTYSEFKSFKSGQHGNDAEIFRAFLRFGGMPGIHRLEFSEEPVYQYLSAMVDSVLLKDVVLRNNIRDIALLKKLLLFLADNIGNVFSARSVADYLKKERRSLGIETVYNYIDHLEAAFIINRVSRYDIKGKRYLETHEKYYMADLGLRHALVGYREYDINLFLENIVYIELRKRGYSVSIGRSGEFEIDFIAVRGNYCAYVQVAYLLGNESTREREFRSLRLIPDNHPKFVITMDDLPEGNVEGIHWMNFFTFLESDFGFSV